MYLFIYYALVSHLIYGGYNRFYFTMEGHNAIYSYYCTDSCLGFIL